MTSKFARLVDIFQTFFKIGPITFGGGYAMIPQIEREAVELRKWLSAEEVVDLLAVAGAAPGAIGVNAAFAIGYRVAGVAGALAAFFGVLLPTFLIVVGLTISYLMLRDNPKVGAIIEGIRPAVVALILYAGVRVRKSSLVDIPTWIIFAVGLALLLFLGTQPLFVILAAPFAGIGISLFKKDKGPAAPAAQKMTAAAKEQPSEEPQNQEKSSKTDYKYPDYFIGDGI